MSEWVEMMGGMVAIIEAMAVGLDEVSYVYRRT